jgi:hypothetical protein
MNAKQRPIGPIDVICNGDLVSDKITGFTGIVVAMTQYLNGCVQCCVQPQELDGPKPAGDHWFDEQRLVVNKQGEFYVDKRPEGIGFRI